MNALLNLIEKRSINTKLLVGFGIGLMIALAVGVNAIQSLRTMSEKTQQIYEFELLGISHLKEANINLIYMGRSLRHMMLASTTEERDKARARLDLATLTLGKELGEARIRTAQKEEKQKFDEFDVLFDQYKRNVADAVALLEKDELRKGLAINLIFSDRFQKIVNSTDDTLTAITKVKENGAANTAAALEQMTESSIRISLILLGAGLVIGIVFGAMIGRSISNPIERLRQSIGGLAAGEVDQIVPYIDYRNELGAMARSLKSLQDTVREMEDQRWIKAHAAEIASALQQADDFKKLAQTAISRIAPVVNAGHGAVYVVDSDSRFNLLGSYGYRERKHLNNSFMVGEGLIGQAAMEKASITLTAPKDYIQINSGLGEAPPACVAVLPIIHQERVLAVLEIASFQQLTEREIALLDVLKPMLATTMEIMDRNLRTRELLVSTQEQAERMEKQAAQLEEQTVEMEAQQAELLETENWFRSIIESAPEGLLVVDESGLIVLANLKATQLFGYEGSEMVGINADKLMPECNTFRQGEQPIDELMNDLMALNGQVDGVSKAGLAFPFLAFLNPLPARGHRGRCVSVAVRPLTARES